MATNPSSSDATETQALKAVYAAINRNDVPAALEFFDPQIERIEFEGTPAGGAYHGLAEVRANIANGRGTWAEGSCDPEQFLVAGDKVVVFLHVHVRLKDKADWIDGRFADTFVFRNGKAIEWRSFAERHEALEWAEIEAPTERGA